MPKYARKSQLNITHVLTLHVEQLRVPEISANLLTPFFFSADYNMEESRYEYWNELASPWSFDSAEDLRLRKEYYDRLKYEINHPFNNFSKESNDSKAKG